jgi:hypothetical protein
MTITIARPKAGRLGLRTANPKESVRLFLKARSVLTLDPTSDGLEVCCPTGRLWLTQEGDGTDHILEPGTSFRTESVGRIVVEALADATFSVCAR